MIGIIPAAGLATRIGELPKFLLPISNSGDTLLSRHIELMMPHVHQIVIVTRPENAMLLKKFSSVNNLVIMIAETRSMSETVMRVTKFFSKEQYLLGMPDTYFEGDPYSALIADVIDGVSSFLAYWPIREEQKGKLGQVKLDSDGFIVDIQDKVNDCPYQYFWGALRFDEAMMSFSQVEDAHIGFAFERALRSGMKIGSTAVNGRYFDCGTPDQFLEMLLHSNNLGID